MTVSPEYKAYIEELFSGLGPVAVRSMFGGAGIFLNDIMFALIADETVYLKVDETNKPEFEAEGMGPFTYESKSKPMQMSYYELPERLYDSPDDLIDWARKAYDAALKAKKPRPKKSKSVRRKK